MPTETIGENTGDDYGGNSIDTRIRGVSPTTNFGSSASLAMFRNAVGDMINGLFSFPDITSISGPVTVSSSSINIYMTGDNGGETLSVEARKLLRDWVEAQATYNIYSTGNNWTTAGALSDGNDRNATVSATSSINTTTGEYKTFTGSQLDTDNENDINGSTTHYGHVYEHNASVTSSFKSIEMSEGTDGQRPYSSITYTAAGDTLTASDGFEMSDSMSMTAAVSMSMSDTIEIIDTASLTAASDMNMNENLEISDNLSGIVAALMGLTDTVEFSDTASAVASVLMSLSDTAVFSEQVSLITGNIMNLSDNAELLDTFSADSGVVSMTMADNVSFTEAFNAISSAVLSLEDGIVLTDIVSLSTDELVEGPIKISVQVKQVKFDIVVKKPGFEVDVKKPKFDIEIN